MDTIKLSTEETERIVYDFLTKSEQWGFATGLINIREERVRGVYRTVYVKDGDGYNQKSFNYCIYESFNRRIPSGFFSLRRQQNTEKVKHRYEVSVAKSSSRYTTVLDTNGIGYATSSLITHKFDSLAQSALARSLKDGVLAREELLKYL